MFVPGENILDKKMVMFLSSVAGQWGGWMPWSSCSKTCGGGTQTKSRLCNSPPPADGGNYCQGAASESRSCSNNRCGGGSVVIINTVSAIDYLENIQALLLSFVPGDPAG